MSKVWLEIAEDKSRPEGGHAVIRLHGVADLSQQPTFTIDPIDGETGETRARINGAFSPLSTRQTPDGLELVIGPDVVENPALLPGTPVAIEVAAAGVRAEVLWPSIMPLVRQRRQPVVMSTARRLTVVQAGRDQSRAVVAAGGGRPRVVEAVVPATDAKPGEPAPIPFAAVATAAHAARQAVAVEPLAVAARAPVPLRDTVIPLPRSLAAEAARSAEMAAAADAATAAAIAPSAAPAPVAPMLAPTPTSTALEPAAPRPAPAAIAHQADTDALGRRLSGIAMLMALLAIGSSLLVLQMVRSMRGGSSTPAQLATAAPAASGALSPALPAPPSAMYEIFKVGTLSPRGTESGGVDIAKALALADTYIHSSGSARDLREGEFWLKRALAMSLGDDRSRWALTQLGSLYAAPAEGDPSYEKARLAWEMAAGLGDSVAMCFLGNLHQFGLGVPASRSTALRWYELAKQSGGCRGVDDMIARVKR